MHSAAYPTMAVSGDGDNKGLMRIGRAAQMAGVSKQSLQYYLLVGVVECTQRSGSGQQLFDSDAVERIRLVKELNESGYPLREIRDIFLRRESHQSSGGGGQQ